MGRLKPYSEIIIKISCFNDVYGDFDDTLNCEIEGLDNI